MPFYLMMLYGSIMIVFVLILRGLFRNRLPKFVFPVLWGVVLLRFLIPFSVSSPLSIPIPGSFLRPYMVNYSSSSAAAESVVQDTGSSEGVTVMTGDAAAEYVADSMRSFPAAGSADSSASHDSVTLIDEESESVSGVTYSNYSNVHYAFYSSNGNNYITALWIVVGIYFLGLAIVAGILAWQKYRYLKRLRGGFLVEHNETINTILRDIGMGHVLVFTNDEIASPMVCGLFNPRIYLPTQMDFRNTLLLRHVLAHETMHIRRGDNWIKCVMVIVLFLNWFNPLVWIMAKCLASDLEAACDAEVLRQCGEEEKTDYASSLLAMAISGSRISLLYSAFSKTEVEKRVKNILSYKRMTFLALLATVLLLAGSMTAFASIGQAPFRNELTSFCYSDNSRWGVRVTITRDIMLGKEHQKRAEEVVFSVLGTDETGDPKVIEDRILTALSQEFGVERGAFHVETGFVFNDESLKEEYEPYGLSVKGDNPTWTYQGEKLRVFKDEMVGNYYSDEQGTVDVYVQRNDLGEITSVDVWHEGDSEYDERTKKYEREKYSWSGSVTEDSGTAEKITQIY